MNDIILLDMTIFDNVITETHKLWGEYNSGIEILSEKHKEAMDLNYWENAYVESFEYTMSCMLKAVNQCSRNYSYLNSILKQVKYDFECADTAGASASGI